MRFFLCALSLATGLTLYAQDTGTNVPPPPPGPVIKAEKRLVLVDAIVADKHGNYVRDLTAKDFRVWEDKKEQDIESFSFESGGNNPNAQKRYLILFFDNSTMAFAEQAQARKAAQQFIDTNAGPNKEVAVVNFGGSLQIAQNFTEDTERLKQAINGIKFSSVSPNGDIGGGALSAAAAQFGARDVLLALRNLAKGLANVPGRKTLVFLSSGFPLDSELRSELTAVVSVCNRNNVAIYPIDVRGLVTGMPGAGHSQLFNGYPGVHLVTASYVQQRGGGTTGSGAGSTGGTRGGGTTSSTPTRAPSAPANNNNVNRNPLNNPMNPNSPLNPNNPFNQARSLIPLIPNITGNQEVLYDLANGTGGFVIVNTNDLLGGLQKIGHEQDAYYILGYSPLEESKEGACHDLKVKVDRGGTEVRARTGYCTARAADLLAGSPVEHELETRAAAAAPGNVKASMVLPFFYTSSNTARVNVAMEIPADALQFAKEKGKQHSEMNVLGIVTDSQGSIAARFSDNVKVNFENKKEVEQFQEKPMHYETQFDIGAGKYNVKVVFSAGGQGFGKLEVPLSVDPYENSRFGISSVALSHEVHRVSELDMALDATLLQDHTPLVSQGMEIVPTASTTFSKTGTAVAYLEVYEPALQQSPRPPDTFKIGIDMKLVDKKTGQAKVDTGYFTLMPYVTAGNPMIPVGLRIPIEKLDPGSYIAQFQAMDTAGNSSVLRSAEIEVR